MSEFWDMVEDGLISESSGEWIGGFGRRSKDWRPNCEIRTPDKVECKLCVGRWYTPSGLIVHNMKEHPSLPLPEGYARCPECRVCMLKHNLARHIRKKHEEDEE